MTENPGALSKRPNAGQQLRKVGSKAWRALAEFEDAVGGRLALIETIALAPKDIKQQKILGLLADPARQTCSLASILADAGVYANEILILFREGSFAKAYAQANQILAERLPEVMEDVAAKATDHFEPCACTIALDGFTGAADPECKTCKGIGKVFRRASKDHQEMVLEATDMLRRGTGVSVQVQQNNVVGTNSGFLDKFVKGTDAAALDVIEAETVPPDGEGE